MFKLKSIIAINISDYSIETIEADGGKDGITVKSYNRVLLESGIVEDGKIIDEEKLKVAIKILLSQAKPHATNTRDVALTIPESKIFSQTYKVPKSLQQKQVSSVLFSRAQESLPIDASLIAADFLETSRAADAVEYIFIATYKDLLKEYTSLFQSLHLKVELVTMESLALAQAVIDPTKDETILLLDIGSRTTIASIFKGGRLQETININIAGNNITAALAEKLKISRAEAEQKKVLVGLSPKDSDGSIMLVIQGQLQPLKDELLLFIKYYENKTKDAIDKVLLGGGTSALIGLREYFEANLGASTTVAIPIRQFKVPDQQLSPTQYMVALGLASLALDERHAINFLSRADKDWGAGKRIALDESIPSIPDRATAPSASGQRLKSKKKIGALLIILAVVLAGFVAILLWKNKKIPFLPSSPTANITTDKTGLPPTLKRNFNIIIKPFTGTDSSFGQTLTFTFDVSLAGTGEGLPAIAGSIETTEIEGPVKFDASTQDIVRRRLVYDLKREPTGGEVDAAVKEYLADQIWKEKLNGQFSYLAADRMLITSYISKSIESSVLQEKIEAGDVRTMILKVKYRALILSNPDVLKALEDEHIKYFTERNPGLKETRKEYTFDERAGSNKIKVTALYYFEKELNNN